MANEILLIDSDKSHAEALKVYIERLQFEVYTVGRGSEALLMLDNISPDIVLADPKLPETDIIALLKQLKKTDPLIQIIIFSDTKTLDMAMEELNSTAITYLTKPLKSQALDLALEQARKWILLNQKLDRYVQKLGDLHQAQSLYQQLFNEVPCYISVQDREFRLTATNRRFKQDFGDEIGSYCYEVYKHRTSPCPKCAVAATFKDGKSHQTEEIVTSKSGKQYNVLTWTAPIRNDVGHITQVMEMSTNITQIRQLQDHLISLGLMLGSMSHGVKGMLTALDGGIYRLESGILNKDMERIGPAFDQVVQITGRIRKMVLEILYYAKSRALHYKKIETSKLTDTVVATIEPYAAKSDIRLDVDIAESLGSIEIDPNWVQAALINFLENAVDACTYDRHKEDHRVLFQVYVSNHSRICFNIEDNGMGMDQETREKMFTLFFTSKGSQGTGLGLFIANRVIQQHGGAIQVESKPQEGTLVQICLPRKRPEPLDMIDIPEKES
jgi:signal transduction histidine kinase/DNA-binding response OmpR family regulator